MRGAARSQYDILLTRGDPPEAFVRAALRLCEEELRELALVALADWERTELVRTELFGALTSLQRPSFGTWNGLIQGLRRARRAALREGGEDVRRRVGKTRQLEAVLRLLDERLPKDLVEALSGLSALTGVSPRRLTRARAMEMTIALRNRVAHDLPQEPSWWQEAADGLGPLVRYLADAPAAERLAPERPAPWFRRQEDGSVLHFSGLTNDFAVRYAGSAAEPDGDSGAAVLLALSRMLGKADVQEVDFRRLLSRLAPEDEKGVLLGDFLVGRPVGSGGYATVHVGRQLSTGRKVAVKILRDGLGDDAELRFQQEAAYLSQLAHPNIVSVVGYGQDPWLAPRHVSLEGEPWFDSFSRSAPVKTYMALEWIDGRTIEDVIAEGAAGRPDEPVLLDWFLQATLALEAVHAVGLIHRDVKPANLMVTDDGAIKLMDFGIARSQDEDRTLMTTAGTSLGTPAYMSPEQIVARDADAEVGAATDIYGLSATFYELFTSSRVFAHDREAHETVKTKKLSGDLPPSPRRLNPALPWEIATLLVGGLRKEAELRPGSMEALARDIRNVQQQRAIEYQQPGIARRMLLTYRRNRQPFHLLGLFVLVAVAGVVFYIRSVDAERQRAEEQRAIAQEQRAIAEDEARRARDGLRVASARRAMERSPRVAAVLLREVERPDEVLDWHALAVTLLNGRPAPEVVLRGHRVMVSSVSFSPDGARVLTGSADGTARLWWADGTGEPLVLDAGGGAVNAAAFSPDGSRLVTASADGAVRLWPSDREAAPVVLGQHDKAACVAAVAPDGDRVLTGSLDQTVRVWPAAGKGDAVVLAGHDDQVCSASFSPDGTRVVTASRDGTARVWTVDGAKVAVLEHEGPVNTAAFAPDGSSVVTASDDGTARVWAVDGGEPVVFQHDGQVSSASFAADGTWVVTVSDRAVRRWSADGAGAPEELGDYGGMKIKTAALSPDGNRLAVVSFAGTGAFVWRTDRDEERLFLGGQTMVDTVAFSPDGARIATSSEDGTVRVWRPERSGASRVLEGGEGAARTWRADGTMNEEVLADQEDVAAAAFSRDGEWVVTASDDGTARVWRTDGGGQAVVLEGHEDELLTAAFSPDGTRVVTGSDDWDARVWRLDQPEDPVVLRHDGPVFAAAFSPGGTRVVTASSRWTARIWPADGDADPVVLRVDEGPIKAPFVSAAFSPEGDRVVTASGSRAWIWRTDGAGDPVVLEAPGDTLTAAAFTPDGNEVVTTSQDGATRLWTVGTSGLRAALWKATRDCLTIDERRVYLAQDESGARAELARCREHLRQP